MKPELEIYYEFVLETLDTSDYMLDYIDLPTLFGLYKTWHKSNFDGRVASMKEFKIRLEECIRRCLMGFVKDDKLFGLTIKNRIEDELLLED